METANSIGADAGVNNFFADLNPSDAANAIETLFNRFDDSEVDDALGNVLSGSVADLVKAMVNGSDLPEFIQDLANEAIDSAVAEQKSAASAEAEQETQGAFQEIIDQILEQFNEDINEALNEDLEGAGAGSEAEGSGKGEGQGGGNWLAVLAKAMGDVAGKHLGNSVRLSEEIGRNSASGEDSDVQAEKMAGLQAEMQAETQMFKLTQEAVSTIVKSVGEALSSTARKQ